MSRENGHKVFQNHPVPIVRKALPPRTFENSAMTATPRDNPYLAHLPPSERGAGASGSNPVSKEPLFGFMPRRVKGEQVRKAMVCFRVFHLFNARSKCPIFSQEHDINPFTKQPLSGQYKKILEARKKLPVYAKMDEFFQMVRDRL